MGVQTDEQSLQPDTAQAGKRTDLRHADTQNLYTQARAHDLYMHGWTDRWAGRHTGR